MQINYTKEQIKKLQDFYDNWMKPLKDKMSPQLLSDMKKLVDKYSLTK